MAERSRPAPLLFICPPILLVAPSGSLLLSSSYILEQPLGLMSFMSMLKKELWFILQRYPTDNVWVVSESISCCYVTAALILRPSESLNDISYSTIRQLSPINVKGEQQKRSAKALGQTEPYRFHCRIFSHLSTGTEYGTGGQYHSLLLLLLRRYVSALLSAYLILHECGMVQDDTLSGPPLQGFSSQRVTLLRTSTSPSRLLA